MSNLNALIAQGVQFKAPPDPFEQYGKMQQLTQNQQANQLNVMKLDEARRSVEEQNMLRQLNPGAADYLAQVSKINPKLGFEYGKLQSDAENAKLTQQKTRVEVAAAKKKFEAQAKRDISQNPSDAQITAYVEDVMRSDMYTEAEKAESQQELAQLLAIPFEQRSAFFASQGATAGELKPNFSTQNLGSTVQQLQTPAFGGSAQVVPGSVQNVTMTPGQAEQIRLSEARLAQGEARIAQGERRLDNAETKQAAGPKLKPVPVHAQKAISGAAKSLSDLDRAIALLESKAGKDATGLKGYLPNPVLQRMYPEGVETRAAVADIGSLLLHDRSGAAVTAAEYPRQIPFIPSINDDGPTALVKLKRMRQNQLEDAEALAATYTEEQGFAPFAAKGSGGTPAPATPAAPPAPPALAAAPATQPIYAVNPTTKQRIMSTDGGNTWAPAR